MYPKLAINTSATPTAIGNTATGSLPRWELLFKPHPGHPVGRRRSLVVGSMAQSLSEPNIYFCGQAASVFGWMIKASGGSTSGARN